jgi:putative radical SAM enzyme (TIGR03279 family)
MARITGVAENSPAYKAGIKEGDWLLEVNGHPIADVLDYRFYITEKTVVLKLHRESDIFEVTIRKGEYDDPGLEFESYLMDEKRSCRNKCVFCFIDQLPKGMRETLYFKDDDSRLSFLQGNYVTLTNMTNEDLDRIVEMHITPVNVSVHTTNPELREKMMKNRFAGRILEQMERLAKGGVQMNCQLVICKGLNEGAELDRSMRDLERFFPCVDSVSVVPAGLTCHRDGLYPLEPFGKEDAERLIEQVNAFGEYCKKKHGVRMFYVADEVYVRAGRPLPEEEYYDGYPQIENGVGMMTSMEAELDAELSFLEEEYDVSAKRSLSVATGAAAYDYICRLVAKIEKICYNTTIRVYRIENNFFGPTVTVAGLICGGDLTEQLKGKELGEKLVLPSVMLRASGDLFLDGFSRQDVEDTLGVPVWYSETDGASFVRALLS